MKINVGLIHKEFSRDLYWIKIILLESNSDRKSVILACVSYENLEDHFNGNLEKWKTDVLEKWEKIGNQIFDQNIHYDVYSNTQEGEANGLNFLMEIQ